MKKLFAFLMAATILLSFAACSNDTEENNPINSPENSTEVRPSDVPNSEAPSDTDGEENASELSVEDIWTAISDGLGESIPSTVDLDDEGIKNTAGVDSEKLVQYVYKYPLMNVSATEFFIAECKDGELENVKEEILAHQKALEEQWKQYLPAQYELVQNYKLETKDNYIFLCVSETADEAVQIFNDCFK